VALRGAVLLVLLLTGTAAAQDNERLAMSRVRFTTDHIIPPGCFFLGALADDSLKDLRRKIVRVGGNTGVLAFPPDDMERIHADAYRCPPPAAAPPPPPSPPPGVPPPPPGPPPPPPPR
jgi:hypothetical protein